MESEAAKRYAILWPGPVSGKRSGIVEALETCFAPAWRTCLLALFLLFSSTAGADFSSLDGIREQVRAGQLGNALAQLRAYRRDQPDNLDARLLLGVVHTQLGDIESAILSFEELARDEPDVPETYNNLAVLYASRGQYEKARAALHTAVRLQPDYATAHENLADIHVKLAIQGYQRSVKLEPGRGKARDKLRGLSKMFSFGGGAAPLPESARPTGPWRGKSDRPGSCYILAGKAPSGPLLEWLDKHGVTSKARQSGRPVRIHRVYVAPQASRQKAITLIGELRGKGVTDIQLIRDGERKNGISVGVYRQVSSVDRRRAEFGRLGVETRVAIQTVTRDQPWTLLRSAGKPFSSTTFRRQFPGTRIEPVRCPP